jgi:transaldolase
MALPGLASEIAEKPHKMVKRAVFLDRDGVLNANIERDGRPVAPTTLADFRLLPGVAEAVHRLKRAGFVVVVVTNQPDVATGRTPRHVVEAMNAQLCTSMPVDDLKICYHVDEDRCACRKPQPGMIFEAAREHAIDLPGSYMIGDRWRDMEAGRQAGCRTVFVDSGYRQDGPMYPDRIVSSLPEAIDFILRELDGGNGEKARTIMSAPNADRLNLRIFVDGANVDAIRKAAPDPRVQGFTTNPTLMRAAKVNDYERFAAEVLNIVPDRPVCFEVLADDLSGMEAQAREIASWGSNVYVKIPVTNTAGVSTAPIIASLSAAGIKLNITAILTLEQVATVAQALADKTPAIVSVFAGRIADTGRDPVPLMTEALRLLRSRPRSELLWASPRELLNVFQADAIGCHIITITDDLFRKLALVGKDLDEFSRETVAMFYRDAVASGYSIPLAEKRAVS